MKTWKKRLTAVALASSIAFTALPAAAANPFKDIKGHWAENVIDWAYNEKITYGYPGGLFMPNKTLIEKEFLAMLIRSYTDAFGPEKMKEMEEKGFAGFYEFARIQNYPVVKQDGFITRQQVANLVVGTQGKNYTGRDAIHYLLLNGLASGKDPNKITIANFGAEDILTRAEAVSFIQNVLSKGIKLSDGTPILYPRPADPSEPLPKIGDNDPITPIGKEPTTPPKQEPAKKWTPGEYTVLGKKTFTNFKDNGTSVTFTMPKIDGYDFGGQYHDDTKFMDLEVGKTYKFEKGKNGVIFVAMRKSSGDITIEGYAILVDEGKVKDAITRETVPLNSIFEGLGLE
ncbi:S-layer homology domain-containing protein [Schinkia azotoformans]|uniref:S-layer homology domain-containing protein n=1 Tax=Schinkia azotoformans TaxID=1454 RepID=UPI002E1E21AA|nr:S-layer homology domain-containing protein [Schinkia azotoformans]